MCLFMMLFYVMCMFLATPLFRLHSSFMQPHAPSQEFLQLDISQRHVGQWLSHNWAKWAQFVETCGVPAATMIRSGASQRQRTTSDTVAEVGIADPAFVLPEWACRGPAMLLILGRLSLHLKDSPRANARLLLHRLVDEACSCGPSWSHPRVVDASTCVQSAGRNTEVQLKILDGQLSAQSLVTSFPALRRLARTPLASAC